MIPATPPEPEARSVVGLPARSPGEAHHCDHRYGRPGRPGRTRLRLRARAGTRRRGLDLDGADVASISGRPGKEPLIRGDPGCPVVLTRPGRDRVDERAAGERLTRL